MLSKYVFLLGICCLLSCSLFCLSFLFSLTNIPVFFNKTSLNNFFSVLVYPGKGLQLINLRVSSLKNIPASFDLSIVLFYLPVNGINFSLVLAVFPDYYSIEISIQVVTKFGRDNLCFRVILLS